MVDATVTPNIQLIPHAALAYMASKKLKTSYHWYEVYAQEHNHVFTVAKIMEMDVLNEIHKGILQAIEKGETFEHFKKNILNRLGEKGWGNFSQTDEKTGETITRLSDSRLKKIYFVNKTQARQKGNWARFEESKETFPYLRYRLGASRQHRESHLRFKDLVLRVDDPFWDTHMPMNGWGCKCWVQQLTEEQAQEQGISESPKIEYHDWINPATGEIHKVPKGISPGFEYNVGKSQNQNDLATISTKITGFLENAPIYATKLFDILYKNNLYLEQAFHDWIQSINQTKYPRGQTMVVGAIDDSVMKKLMTIGKAPITPIIAIRDEDIFHALRDSKKAYGGALPLAFWETLPQQLKNPDAILLQGMEEQRAKNATDNLLFVYNFPYGKVVMKINYQIAVKNEVSNKKGKVKANIVRTGSIITNANDLKELKVLWKKR